MVTHICTELHSLQNCVTALLDPFHTSNEVEKEGIMTNT